jgi:hypothetical protein
MIWVTGVGLTVAQSLAIRMDIHDLHGADMAKFKALRAPIQKERTRLLLEHQAEMPKPSVAYRVERKKLVSREESAKVAFFKTRTPDVSEVFTTPLGVPFGKRVRFKNKDLLFRGKTQPSDALYWPSPDHVRKFIPCRYRITYGDRLLRSSANPGVLVTTKERD